MFLSSCASVMPPVDESVFYRRDMEIKVGDQASSGAIVVKTSPVNFYKFDIHAKGKLDLFTFTTCHREQIIEEAGENGIFGNKKRVKINYQPVEGIETEYCPINLGGYERMKQRHSWGFIDFEYGADLEATSRCNGETTRGPVTVCQARAGLFQQLVFEEPVTVNPSPLCKWENSTTNNMLFEYNIKPRECVYAFITSDGRIHRHTTLGYESFLIRED